MVQHCKLSTLLLRVAWVILALGISCRPTYREIKEIIYGCGRIWVSFGPITLIYGSTFTRSYLKENAEYSSHSFYYLRPEGLEDSPIGELNVFAYQQEIVSISVGQTDKFQALISVVSVSVAHG